MIPFHKLDSKKKFLLLILVILWRTKDSIVLANEFKEIKQYNMLNI